MIGIYDDKMRTENCDHPWTEVEEGGKILSVSRVKEDPLVHERIVE